MRALRILLVVVVVLGGIFVAVDRAAVYFAESEAEGRIRVDGASIGSTDVSIKGFPFLTQLAGSKIGEVDVELTGVETSAAGRTLRISRMNAQLHDVKLEDGYSRATATTAEGTAVISYADLTKAAGQDVAVEYGGDHKVKVTGSVDLLGRTITRSVLSSVGLSGGRTLTVHADKVPGEGIPGVEDLVRRRTDFQREIGGLPNGLKLEKIQPTAAGVEISVGGTDVALDDDLT